MAKKIQKKIHVKNPKIGKDYYFYFAGGWDFGTLIRADEKLTNHYGHAWFFFENTNSIEGRTMRYPAAIYDIRDKKPKNISNV